MKIAFYISDHGFGHIMRNLPVIKEVLAKGHKVILVTGERQMSLAKQYLNGDMSNVIPIAMHTDAGLLVKPGTLQIDTEATEQVVESYVAEFPVRIAQAKKLFKDHHVDAVVVDIVPWALTAAKEAGVPSYFMASFTWIEQYEWFLPKELLEIFNRSFRDVDTVLQYELANSPTSTRYPASVPIGFVARPFHEDKVEEIKAQHDQPIVFLSLGGSSSGLDFDIDVSNLPYDFITTEGFRLRGENVTFLPCHVENTQDYMKAAKFCISKAGWTSVSELMLAGSKTALVTRPDVPEDTMIIEELLDRNEIMAVSVNELKNMGAVLGRMEEHVWKDLHYRNGYKKVADIIC